MNVVEFAVATGDQALYRSENIQLGEDPKRQTVAPRPGVGAGGAHLGGGGGHIWGREGELLTLLSPCTRLQKQHPQGEGRAGPQPPTPQEHRLGQR